MRLDQRTITAKSTFPASDKQKLRSWQTVDAVCQGPVLNPAQNCANLPPNRPVIRWMSAQSTHEGRGHTNCDLLEKLCTRQASEAKSDHCTRSFEQNLAASSDEQISELRGMACTGRGVSEGATGGGLWHGCSFQRSVWQKMGPVAARLQTTD